MRYGVFTDTVTPFDNVPFTFSSKVWSLLARFGTNTFTWPMPIIPGARPEKTTWAGAVPMVAVVIAFVFESVVSGAAAPVGTAGVTRPWPVKNTCSALPTTAGFWSVLTLES